uniref:REC114 meiotic recombination protein n=1 Tax=Cyanoderma ruficeps TaxID=181631 RepID=A0A8C3NZQ1_9PASS
MAAAGGVRGSQPGMASASGSAGDTSLLGSATVWPLKRYGRFLPPKDGDDEGRNSVLAGPDFALSVFLKVFESNEESGPLVLTIVESGHFFISQERTVLEGFSLIDSHKWLKIVRKAECLLLRAQAKNECRMFRVQFGGSCREEMQQHCCSCVQKLSQYVPVQGTEEHKHQTQAGPARQGCVILYVTDDIPRAPNPGRPGLQQGWAVAVPCPEVRAPLPLFRLQSVLRRRPELPPALRHPVWSARELGPFIRLCLLDQHFPAFVQDVERELNYSVKLKRNN